jgi:hypothetical protein
MSQRRGLVADDAGSNAFNIMCVVRNLGSSSQSYVARFSCVQVVPPIQHCIGWSVLCTDTLFMARTFRERWRFWCLPPSFDGDEGEKRLSSPFIHAPNQTFKPGAYERQDGRVIFVGVPSAEPTRANRIASRCTGCAAKTLTTVQL